jgi:hypothetical protein
MGGKVAVLIVLALVVVALYHVAPLLGALNN